MTEMSSRTQRCIFWSIALGDRGISLSFVTCCRCLVDTTPSPHCSGDFTQSLHYNWRGRFWMRLRAVFFFLGIAYQLAFQVSEAVGQGMGSVRDLSWPFLGNDSPACYLSFSCSYFSSYWVAKWPLRPQKVHSWLKALVWICSRQN